jgi:small subunit ribosomal protein S8
MKNITKLTIIMSLIYYYQKLKRQMVVITYSSIAIVFLNFLISEGLINGFSVEETKITVFLKYNFNGSPVIKELKKLSTNRRRVTACLEKLQQNKHQYGIFILSTPVGFITHKTAINAHINGTLLFFVR